jgi:hypothetical protein
MIRLIVIGLIAASATAYGYVLTFTTSPDKKVFGFFEPVEIGAEIRVSPNLVGQSYPEGISGNVVYEVERKISGIYSPVAQNVTGSHYLWQAKTKEITSDNTSLSASMDLRILFDLGAGQYRVRGKYRSDNQSSSFEQVSAWSEFAINAKKESEAAAYEDYENAGRGKDKAEQLASYEAFAAKHSTDHVVGRVYPEMLDIYLKTDHGRALNFLKGVIDNPNISKIKRRLFAYEIASLEEQNGNIDEAIRWYSQSGLRNSEEQIETLKRKKASN